MNVVKDETYLYKELCSLMSEKEKGGNSKKAQLLKWKQFFDWENITKQKYYITEVYDTPREINSNWGGSRKGSGAKVKVQEEFDYIFRQFLYYSYKKNEYYRDTENMYEIYFSNNNINLFFGCYKNLYQEDENVNEDVKMEISNKIREKSRSWIFSKIENIKDITLGKGIVVKEQNHKYYEVRNDLLEEYDLYMEEYLEQNQCKHLGEVFEKKLYQDYQRYILDKFNNKYEVVKKLHRVVFTPEHIQGTMDWEECAKYQKQFNKKLVHEIYQFFLRQAKDSWGSAFEDEPFDEDAAMKDYRYVLQNFIVI